MTVHLARFLLATGLFATLAAALCWLRVARGDGGRPQAVLASRVALAAAAGTLALAEAALIRHDFGVRYVAENGSRDTPLYYTVTSLWSALDGSLLLWLLILAGYLAMTASWVPRGAERLHPWAMLTICGVTAFFFALVLVTTQAFDAVRPVPPDGPGPNPLLADNPAMGVHPPLLYAGFLGLVIPFAYAVAALITGECGPGWLAATRKATLFAWTLLTAGIALGAWWSYSVLGWGGYWAWDPVENASLLPWLVATALLHGMMLARRHPGALRLWNIALAVGGFLFVCAGTFLTRSGLLVSVHAFGQSPVGHALGVFVVVLGAGVVGLMIRRAGQLGLPRPVPTGVNRETALIAHGVVFAALTAIVLIGTAYPVAATLLGGPEVVIGPPYFNRLVAPVGIALLVLMAIGPALHWTRDDRRAAAGRLAVPAALALATTAVLGAAGVTGVPAVLAIAAAVAAAATAIQCGIRTGRRAAGGVLAHLGVAVAAVGITASSAYPVVSERTLIPNELVQVSGVQARLVALTDSTSARWESTTATLEVRDRSGTGTVRTALRYAPEWGMTTSAPAIRRHWHGDTYLTLLQTHSDGAATIRVAVNPFVGLLWAGGALVVLGGVIAAVPGRRSVPAPGSAFPSRRAPSPAPVPALSPPDDLAPERCSPVEMRS